MDRSIKAPTKEAVRKYMQLRQAEHRPPPDMKQIRRQLGWELLDLTCDGLIKR
jgi:hypothetical protein